MNNWYELPMICLITAVAFGIASVVIGRIYRAGENAGKNAERLRWHKQVQKWDIRPIADTRESEWIPEEI